MNVKTVNYQSSNADADLAESLRKTGFAVLVNHPVTPQRIEDIYTSWAAFFAGESKHDWLRDPERQDGFFPFQSENAKGALAKDLKEFYHVYPWGRVPPELEDITRRLYQDLTTLGIELLGWLDDALPDHLRQTLSLPLADMMQESQQSLLRILHYPPVEQAETGAIRAAAHEDINLITLLLSGSKPGLQAKDAAGNWHDIACDAGMITINNGDMLSMASNNYYPSTTHRVINPNAKQNQSRYSMPLFLHPRPEVLLKPGISADDYLQQRLREIGLKPTNA